MRNILLVLLASLACAGTALAESITITAPWTQVRRNPSSGSRAIDIVYGNDTFEVQEARDGWAKITTSRKATGWIPADPALQIQRANPSRTPKGGEPIPAKKESGGEIPASPQKSKSLQATALSNAISLRQLGYREQSREKFTDLMVNHAGTVEAYEATRQMLSYHLVGYLPPLQGGKVTEEGAANLGPVTKDVLLQEAILLQGEKKPVAAARLYQLLLDKDPGNGRAFLGLLDTLQAAMAIALKDKKEQDLERQVAAFKKYFPGVALPAAVEQRSAKS